MVQALRDGHSQSQLRQIRAAAEKIAMNPMAMKATGDFVTSRCAPGPARKRQRKTALDYWSAKSADESSKAREKLELPSWNSKDGRPFSSTAAETTLALLTRRDADVIDETKDCYTHFGDLKALISDEVVSL